ncbi:MAG TPA: hypothetical protein VE135_11860 [Pyrinomonadaceae bacterium]|nr:hypothetical protein [Pyrinomonadaceae bacterium]
MTKRLLLITIIALSSALGSSATAQGPPSDSPGASPKDKALEDKYRSDEIERVRREANAPEYNPSTARFPQIKEDFERIQRINIDVLQANEHDARLDYGRISEAAGEIKRRATRLKSNLFPPAAKGSKKQSEQQWEDRQDLKLLLTELDKAINRFVHNPIFANTRLVNPQDSARAERDLEKIINLSGKTEKKVE